MHGPPAPVPTHPQGPWPQRSTPSLGTSHDPAQGLELGLASTGGLQGPRGGGCPQPPLPAWSPGAQALSVPALELQSCTQPPWEASLPGIRRPRGSPAKVCTVANSKGCPGKQVPGRGRVASLADGPESALGTSEHKPLGGSVTDRVPSREPRHIGSPWGVAAGAAQGAPELPLRPQRRRPQRPKLRAPGSVLWAGPAMWPLGSW